ncbi:MAG: Wzz/FepE/Etk N-terminal domain-containing protein [Actinomycetota bacterium]|nr:Wzz/FepE/Etk N-terminal domain-containing protein [Actinomycetota bacterium]
MALARPDSLELSDYLGVIRRRWWIVLVLLVVGVGIAGAYVKAAPKTYTAAALIQVNPLSNNATAAVGRTSGAVNMDNEAQIVQSNTVASAAAQQLHSPLTGQALVKHISVAVPPNTTFLQISCDASTARGSAACADAFADAYLANRHSTIVSSLSGQLAANQARIASVSKIVASLKNQLVSLPARAASRTTIELSVSADDALLQELVTNDDTMVPLLDGLNLSDNTAVGRVVTPASTPTSPSSPRKLLVLPSGLLAGLLIGLLCAFLVDRRDHRVHTPGEVERFLNIPVLLNISGKAAPAGRLLSSRSKPGQAFTELAQYVAATLGEGDHVLLVAGTSAGPGCSTVAANLAATMARTRSEVVLVCADPESTLTPRLLGIGGVRGLAEVLAGTATVAEVARRPAGVPRLRVITPGIDTSSAVFDLQYDGSRRLLADLREGSRYVIIEAQSVGAYADSFQLAEFADGIIVTVETDLTSRTDAADCLNRLERLRTTVLGAAVVAASRRVRRAATQDPAARPAPSPIPRPRLIQSSRPGKSSRPADPPRPADPTGPAEKPLARSAAEVSHGSRQADETMPLPRATALSLPDRSWKTPEIKSPPDEASGA